MKTTTHKIYLTQVQIVKIMAAIVVLLMFAYLYFVNFTAFGAASSERLSESISRTQSEIGELELALIQQRRSINRNLAEQYDLVTVKESDLVFARRNVATRLTINE